MYMWTKYRKKGSIEIRPYLYSPPEDLTNISVSDTDTPEAGGMIIRDPENHEHQWYISLDFFLRNYEAIKK